MAQIPWCGSRCSGIQSLALESRWGGGWVSQGQRPLGATVVGTSFQPKHCPGCLGGPRRSTHNSFLGLSFSFVKYRGQA